MKSKEQIQNRIVDLENDLISMKDWMETAQKRYNEDRKNRGKDVDDGEVRYATDAYNEVERQIKALKWVLI